MINKAPAFMLYVSDWLSSPNIMTMTPAEEGAYIHLLAIAWGNKDCGLPDDDDELAILSRLNKGWFNGSSTKIRKCFFKNKKSGRLFNKRLLIERKKQREWREKSRLGGIQSGKSRQHKKIESNHPSTTLQPPYEPKGNSSFPSPSSKDIILHTPKKEKKQKPAIKKERNLTEPQKLVEAYKEKYKEKFGKDYLYLPYVFMNASTILKQLSFEEATRRLDNAFKYKYWCKNPRNFGQFFKNINEFVELPNPPKMTDKEYYGDKKRVIKKPETKGNFVPAPVIIETEPVHISKCLDRKTQAKIDATKKKMGIKNKKT